MEEKSKIRAQKVLECLADGKAKSPSEIFNETKVSKLDSLLHEMWKKG